MKNVQILIKSNACKLVKFNNIEIHERD